MRVCQFRDDHELQLARDTYLKTPTSSYCGCRGLVA